MASTFAQAPIELLSFPAASRSSSPGLETLDREQDISEAATRTPSLSPSRTSSFKRIHPGEYVAELGARELPQVDRGWHAWLFLVNAFVLETMIWGYSFTFGIVQVYLATHEPFQGSSIAAISSVGTTALALQYILPAGVMLVFRRYPDKAKLFLWIATGVSVGSMLVSSWATETWQLILLQGVLGGTSGAVLYTPVLLWLQDYWVERRGMASGLIFAGTGRASFLSFLPELKLTSLRAVGGFVFPFLIGSLLDRVGFPWTIRIWAGITLITFCGSIATLRPRLPAVLPTRGEARGGFVPLDTSFLSNPVVILMSVTTFLSSLSFFPVSLYIPTYTVALASPLSANVVLAVYNASSVLGQVGIGWVSDRLSYPKIISFLGFASSLTAFFAWGFADTLGKVFGFAVLFGTFSGICSVWSAVARDVSGTNSQISSLIFCCFGVCRGIASIVGPIIASTLYDEQRAEDTSTWGRFGFRNVTIFVGAMALVSAVGGAGLGVAKKIKVQRD